MRLWTSHRLVVPSVSTMSVWLEYFSWCWVVELLKRSQDWSLQMPFPHFFTSEFWVVSNYKRLSPTVWRSEEAHRWKEGRCVGTSIKQMCSSPMPVTARPRLWGRTLCTWHYMRLTQLTWRIPTQSGWKERGRSADRKFSEPLQPHREQTVDATCYDRFVTFSGQLAHLCLSG